MKTFSLVFFSFLAFFSLPNVAFAQKKIIGTNPNRPYAFFLKANNENYLDLKIRVNYYSLAKKTIGKKTYDCVSLENSSKRIKEGAPELPKITKSIIVPHDKFSQLEVLHATYVEVENLQIIPSRGRIKHSSKNKAYSLGEEYSADAFYPSEIANLRKPYYLRDYKGQTIVVSPFQYNPVTQKLRVYKEISMRIWFKKANKSGGMNPTKHKTNKPATAQFDNIYKTHFLNYKTKRTYLPVRENGNMLIVSPEKYHAQLRPFVEWKSQCGIQAEIVSSEQFADVDEMKKFITDYYNSMGITFLLLVGDNKDIPPYRKNGSSDAAYGQLAGNDSYAEVIVGRFSVENEEQLETMMHKSISYERDPDYNASWYKNAVLVASSEGPGDDGEYDFQHMQNIKPDLLNYTYSKVYELYDGSQGGDDLDGNPSKEMIISSINKGCGTLQYIGHGYYDFMKTSGFGNKDVAKLRNYKQLPFVVSVACENGDFTNKTCLAEALTRANEQGVPTGAVAMFASSIEQDWDPPMEAHDEMIDILTETYAKNIKRTIGGITTNGCMKMNDEYGEMGDAMTDTWILFGDPSLMLRTDAPDSIAVSHEPQIVVGQTSFEINANAENARIAITKGNRIFAKGNIVENKAKLNFDSFEEPDTLVLSITAFNKIPYIKKIPVIIQKEPFLAHTQIVVKSSQNAADEVNYGDTCTLDVELRNTGVDNAKSVTAKLLTNDPFYQIIEDTSTFGNIDTFKSVKIADAYKIVVSDEIPNNRLSEFILEISDFKGNIWYSSFQIKANAPEISMTILNINDNTGNKNKRPDPGETIEIQFGLENRSKINLQNISCDFASESQYLEIQESAKAIKELKAGKVHVLDYRYTLQAETPVGEEIDFELQAKTQKYDFVFKTAQRVGLEIEDWEKKPFSDYKWKSKGDKIWEITDSVKFDGRFSAKSGAIDDEEFSELTIELNALHPDSLSFFIKTSTEKGYDFVEFYIDDELVEDWSGRIDWTFVNYYLSEGFHKFRWIYSRDYSMGSGNNCVWLDNITLPIHHSINDVPKIIHYGDTAALVHHDFEYKIQLEDENVFDKLGLVVKNLPNWLFLQSDMNNGFTFQGKPERNDTGVYQIDIIAYDNEASINDSICLWVYAANALPVFTSEPLTYVKVKHLYQYDILASDPDNEEIEIKAAKKPEWLDFTDYGDGTGMLFGYPDKNDSTLNHVSIYVTDQIDTSYQNFVITVDKTNNVKIVKENKQVFTMFPNPVSDNLIVEVYDNKLTSINIEVLSLSGIKQDVTRQSFADNVGFLRYNVNCSALPPGVYFCKLQFGTHTCFRKFIILRKQ